MAEKMTGKEIIDYLSDIAAQEAIDCKYWLVRSQGGMFYKTYIDNGFIALGFNEVPLEQIKFSRSTEKPKESMSEFVSMLDLKKDDGQPFHIPYVVGQLITFLDIKKGDIVVTPSSDSSYISIGKVVSHVYEEANPTDGCPFQKRFDVVWYGEYSRRKLNPEIQRLFYAHYPIINIDEISTFVNSQVYDYFKEDGNAYLTLRIDKEGPISAASFSVTSDLLNITEDFCKDHNINIDFDNIKMTISVQSPGISVFFSHYQEIIFLLGAVTMCFTGAHIKCDKIGLDIRFKGLIDTINDWIDRRADRKERERVGKKLDKMDIQTPEGLLDYAKHLKNEREKY